jgi:predicted helicase
MEAFDRGYFIRVLSDNFGNGLSNFFPIYLRSPLFNNTDSAAVSPNLTKPAVDYLKQHAIAADVEELFYHVLAILHAPAYRLENRGVLRQDWPRIPLPPRRERLLASAELGQQVAVLLDVESAVPGVTSGNIREELKVIAVPTSSESKNFDLKVNAGWGHAGQRRA